MAAASKALQNGDTNLCKLMMIEMDHAVHFEALRVSGSMDKHGMRC